MYNNYYGNTDVMGYGTALLGLSFGIMVFSFIISLIMIISYWKIFTKAGKPGWASIVPFYNIIVMLEIAQLPLWYIVLTFIPIANIYAMFKIYIEIAKKFGKTTGFGIGMTLLGGIFIPLLAFSDNKYENDKNFVKDANNMTFDVQQIVDGGVNLNNPIEQQIPVVENVVPMAEPQIPVVENVVPMAEPQIPAVENVVPMTEPEIPAVENVVPMAEPQIPVVDNVVPMAEPQMPVVENVVPMAEPQIPVVENVVPMAEPQIPVVENVVPMAEPQIPVVENVEAQINAFNSIPNATAANEIETNTISLDKISGEDIINNLQNSETDKICSACGNKLPDIVSICPNCGTDNE